RASYSPLGVESSEVPEVSDVDEAWVTAARALVRRVQLGPSRKWRAAAKGRRFDVRRTLRASLQTGGESLAPRWLARPRRLPRFGERLLAPNAVVIVASDGLDVGEPDLLRAAMQAIRRRSGAVVWLNPLLDTTGYEPTALGMSTARPFITTFSTVNDLAGFV